MIKKLQLPIYTKKTRKLACQLNMSLEKKYPACGGVEFAEGTDFMPIKPLDKKLAIGFQKIYTFCLQCGEIVSTRVEDPGKFRKYI